MINERRRFLRGAFTSACAVVACFGTTKWDDRGRKYQSIIVGVDPTTGATTNSLVGNSWFDPSGHPIKS